MTEWKDIKGYEEQYQVSNEGEIYSKSTHRILKKGIGKGRANYYLVSLWKHNKGTSKYVHRLVAEAFIENPNNLPTVNHIDGNKLNNHISNLEWASFGENNKHSYDTKLKVVTDKMRKNISGIVTARNLSGYNNRAVIQYDKNMNKIAEFKSIKEAGEKTNTSKTGIVDVCKGNEKRKTANNFIWRYK